MESLCCSSLLFLPSIQSNPGLCQCEPFACVLITVGPGPKSLSCSFGMPLVAGRCSKVCLEPSVLWASRPIEWAGELIWLSASVGIGSTGTEAVPGSCGGRGCAASAFWEHKSLPAMGREEGAQPRVLGCEDKEVSSVGVTGNSLGKVNAALLWMNAEDKMKCHRCTIPNLGLIYVALTVKAIKREKWCVNLLLKDTWAWSSALWTVFVSMAC